MKHTHECPVCGRQRECSSDYCYAVGYLVCAACEQAE